MGLALNTYKLGQKWSENGRCHVYFQEKALKSTGNHKYSPVHPQNNVEVRLDHFCPWLNNIDQGGVGAGVIEVPNLQDGSPAGKKAQNS